MELLEDLTEWQLHSTANKCYLCLHLQFATNGSPFKCGSCPYQDWVGRAPKPEFVGIQALWYNQDCQRSGQRI